MRRSSISMRVGVGSGSSGAEIDDSIYARRSLIEELLSRQYNASTFVVKNEEPNEAEVGVLGSVTLLMSKWDNKMSPSSVPSKIKINTATVNEPALADSNSARSNINVCRYAMNNNEAETNSNRSYSIYTGESDTMTVMIDEDDLSLEDYEDEDLEGGDYDYAEDDDDDDDEVENLELAEALQIVRGRKPWNINDYRARYKALKRKADCDDNSASAKIDNCVSDNHGEKKLLGKPIRMVKIVIEGEHCENSSTKNARLREKYVRVVQSGPVANLRESWARDYQDAENISNGFENANYPLTNYVEAYESVDREVTFYF